MIKNQQNSDRLALKVLENEIKNVITGREKSLKFSKISLKKRRSR